MKLYTNMSSAAEVLLALVLKMFFPAHLPLDVPEGLTTSKNNHPTLPKSMILIHQEPPQIIKYRPIFRGGLITDEVHTLNTHLREIRRPIYKVSWFVAKHPFSRQIAARGRCRRQGQWFSSPAAVNHHGSLPPRI